MKSQDDFVLLIVAKLTEAGIPYMIAGSFLANLYGQPRATHDTDMVVACEKAQLDTFADSLDADYYISQQAIRDAIAHHSMFNVIDTVAGWKADLIIRKARPFSLTEFGRRQSVEFYGQMVSVASPEDAILSKLEWAKKSDSERQLRDAASIVAVQRDALDFAYLDEWAVELGVQAALDTIVKQTDTLGEAKTD